MSQTEAVADPQPAAPAREIKYAPPPPWHRRKEFRYAVFSFAALVVLFWAWRWGPITWRRAQVVYWQGQCLTYAPPADFAVFDDSPTHKVLLQDPRYVSTSSSLGYGGGYAVHDAPAWQRFIQVAQQSRFRVAPVVFLHGRRSPGGNERLVSVQLGYVQGFGGDPWNRLAFIGHASSLGSLLRDPGTTGTSASSAVSQLMMFRRAGDGTRLLAGRPDPTDVTHFTIDYLHNGQLGTIDGWLNDDDSVTLAPRAGQVARETPGSIWWSPGGAPMADWIEKAGGTYDVAAAPIPPHKPFYNRPISIGPRPGDATAPATTPSAPAAPTTAHSP